MKPRKLRWWSTLLRKTLTRLRWKTPCNACGLPEDPELTCLPCLQDAGWIVLNEIMVVSPWRASRYRMGRCLFEGTGTRVSLNMGSEMSLNSSYCTYGD